MKMGPITSLFADMSNIFCGAQYILLTRAPSVSLIFGYLQKDLNRCQTKTCLLSCYLLRFSRMQKVHVGVDRSVVHQNKVLHPPPTLSTKTHLGRPGKSLFYCFVDRVNFASVPVRFSQVGCSECFVKGIGMIITFFFKLLYRPNKSIVNGQAGSASSSCSLVKFANT